jgi:hypothetical protein
MNISLVRSIAGVLGVLVIGVTVAGCAPSSETRLAPAAAAQSQSPAPAPVTFSDTNGGNGNSWTLLTACPSDAAVSSTTGFPGMGVDPNNSIPNNAPGSSGCEYVNAYDQNQIEVSVAMVQASVQAYGATTMMTGAPLIGGTLTDAPSLGTGVQIADTPLGCVVPIAASGSREGGTMIFSIGFVSTGNTITEKWCNNLTATLKLFASQN